MTVNLPSLPLVGASDGTWGQIINDAFAALIAQLSNLDNTNDADKPISTLTANALATKAPLASPALSGIPTAPTAGVGTNSNQLATTAFVAQQLAGGIGVPDASATSKGVVRLAGVLAGTADNPQLATLFPAGPATFGSATRVPVITRDAFGRVTSVTEVSISTTGTGGFSNPMIATGDLIVGGAGGLPTRLIGTSLAARRFLTATGTGTAAGTPQWGTIAVSDVTGASALQSQYVGVNQQTGTSYTPTLGDAGKLVTMANASANTFIIPTNATVGFPVGAWIDVAWYGAGATSIGFNTGVTARSAGNVLTIEKQYRKVRVIKVATNEWLVEGSLAATSQGGGDQGGGSTTTTNLIANQAIQNASDFTKFNGTAAVLTTDTSIAKSGGSSLKITPDGSGAYAYAGPALASQWAPVTAGQTYTGFAQVRLDTNIAAAFQCYLAWYDSSGTQLGLGSSNGQITGVLNNWVQVSSTATAPAGATSAAVIVEYAASGADIVAAATVHVDEIGVNLGTSKVWTSGSTSGGTTSPSSITDAGFSYSGSWTTVTSPSEHYSSTVGNTASVTFTLNAPATFSLIAKLDSSNGTMSASIDGGSAISINLGQSTPQDGAVVWTSNTLAAGSHTIVFTITSPDGSIQGASVTNGAFVAPTGTSTPGGSTGGTGSTSNTTRNGIIIGGPASSSNPGTLAPPTANAFPGYTNILIEDFNTPFSEGRANGSAVLGSGWFSYEGQMNGNYDGMNWDTDQISATNSVVTMRNTNAGSNSQALTPIFRDSANVGKNGYQQAVQYGKFMLRLRSRGVAGYKIAFLLWGTSGAWEDGEIDFPEGDIVSPNSSTPYTMTAATHRVGNNMADMIYKDTASVAGLGAAGRIDDGAYHTCTIHWDPGVVKFEMDGVVVNTVTDSAFVPTKTMRWVLQCEPTNGQENNGAAYVDIDWVAAWKRG